MAARQMVLARAPQSRRRRSATRGPLRALATLVAVLVGLSSLGQFAHFLLVPHAICAEHGELLELGESESHGADHAAPATESSAQASSQLAAEHEHCQLLARGQREQAQPTPPALVVLPPARAACGPPAAARAAVFEAVPALSFAPKTSPPRAVAG
ncbi:MAG: hypothetical protein EOO73_16415 [Myxococcales bacterium]|nr:MAG: hypothetical protein EOO73_16415 [Myxococcales bacterium]